MRRDGTLPVDLAAAARCLHDAERTARDVLERGCAEDLSSLERIVARPLHKARAALEARTSPAVAEHVARRCAGEVFANGSVRFRARFATYASALADAQRQFFDDAATLLEEYAVGLRPPRRIMLPRIDLHDEPSLVPQWNVCSIDRWIDELGKGLCRALERRVDRARRELLKRGAASLIRSRVALRRSASRPIAL